MTTVTYRLLVNLSISDLMITCLCGPVHVIYSLVMGKIDKLTPISWRDKRGLIQNS